MFDFKQMLAQKQAAAQPQNTFPQQPVIQPQASNPAPSPNNPVVPAGFPAFMRPGNIGNAAPVADQRYQKIMEAMKTSRLGGKRNDLPEGTGIFLIKDGMYRKTPTQGANITAFSLLCIKGIEDGQKLIPASAQYTGPRAGETYEYAVFHDSKYPNILGSQYLQITAACMGWTKEQVEQYQAQQDGFQAIAEMMARILCVDAHGNPVVENGVLARSIVANQVLVEITKKTQMKSKKMNGQPVYDATGKPVQQPVTNVYWNKRVWLSDALTQGIFNSEAELVAAFGSPEAAQAAYQTEQQYRQG